MSKSNGFLWGVVIGGAVAATTALLLTPKSGEKLREDLLDQLDDLSDGKASEFAELAKDKSADYAWIGEQLGFVKENSADLLDALKERTSEFVQEFEEDEVEAALAAATPEVDIILDNSNIANDVSDAIEATYEEE